MFVKINVSPVTISKRQNIKFLENLYSYLVRKEWETSDTFLHPTHCWYFLCSIICVLTLPVADSGQAAVQPILKEVSLMCTVFGYQPHNHTSETTWERSWLPNFDRYRFWYSNFKRLTLRFDFRSFILFILQDLEDISYSKCIVLFENSYDLWYNILIRRWWLWLFVKCTCRKFVHS